MRSMMSLIGGGARQAPPPPSVPLCGSCGLHKACRSPKMPVSGEGRRRILIVGEAPGQDEDAQGRQFVGRTGQYLERTLAGLGVDMRRDCWLTNALACWPGPGQDGEPNRSPSNNEVGFCRPAVAQAVRDLSPDVIVPLGSPAVSSVLGRLWKPDPGPVTRWAGFRAPCRRTNAWVCPTYHPSYVTRQESQSPVTSLLWKQHLQAAVSLRGRPWPDGPPDSSKKVRIFLDDDSAAADSIYRMCESTRPVAFDYETTMLKPDAPGAEVWACSLSDGVTSFAFPWRGRAVRAMRRFLRSPVPKVGANVKYEQRWTLAVFGFPAENWLIDTALAAHVLDNRKGVAGIEFQAYALLGAPAWKAAMKDYFRPRRRGGCKNNTPNRIREAPLDELLRYNALDSQYEWEVAEKQAPLLGIDWPA